MTPIRKTCCAVLAWLTLAPAMAPNEAQAAMTATDHPPILSTPQPISVTHMVIDIGVPFASFTQHLENLLGRYDPAASQLVDTDPKAADAMMAKMEGEQGLMIFMIQNHGRLLKLAGLSGQAKRYLVGNPRIALTMTRHDIRAGLYAPLTVLVYETQPGRIRVEYDQPSTLFGQFGNNEVTAIGKTLDDKLSRVIEHAAELSARQP